MDASKLIESMAKWMGRFSIIFLICAVIAAFCALAAAFDRENDAFRMSRMIFKDFCTIAIVLWIFSWLIL